MTMCNDESQHEGLMNKRLLTGTGIALAAVLFGAFNMISSAALRSARFDLTDHQLYTLSDGTKNVLSSLAGTHHAAVLFVEKAGDRTSGNQRLCDTCRRNAGRICTSSWQSAYLASDGP